MTSYKRTPQKRVTIKDIASMAKVSIGTVDRVLHQRGEVNKETHDRIRDIVEELGYTPNLIAKSLALKRSFSIAVLIPGAGKNNPYWKKPVEGFEMAANELKDYNTKITLFSYNLGEELSFVSECERILSLRPDGIILAPHFHKAAAIFVSKCKAQNIPVIFIDNKLDHEHGLAYFGQDAFQSGKVAAKLMYYSLKKDSKVLIVNIAPNKVITHHMQRREWGFTDYFQTEVPDHGIKIVSVAIDQSVKNEPSGTLRKVLSEHPDITGVFVTNSRAHKVAEYFSSAGNRPVMFMGYDIVDDNVFYMEKGVIDILICQKPEDQGYLSAMAMFNFLLTGRQAEKINYSPIDIIIKENINYYNNNNS